MSGNSLRQTVHTHSASVHQAAKLVAALLRVAGVTAGLAESNGSLQPGLWFTSRAGWLPSTGISSGAIRLAIEYGLPLPFTTQNLYRGFKYLQINYTFSYSYDPNSTSSAAKLFNSHSETYLPVNRITSFLFNNWLFTGTNIVEWYVKMGQTHLIT